MDGKMEYSSVPTSADIENNSNTKKYTVNQTPKGKCLISKLLCFFLFMGALLLAAMAALAVYIFVPGCIEAAPEALTYPVEAKTQRIRTEEIDTRLPKSLSPTHYKIKIMPFLWEGNFTTNGFVSIEMNTLETTDKIVVNINDIVVDKQSVRVRHLKTDAFVRIVDQAYHKDAQVYTIILMEKLQKGEQYKLEMNYTGNLNDLMQGFYRSSYVDTAAATPTVRWMASTQFSPTDARRAFPCFDEPAFKATFSISVGRPQNMTSLSNMPKIETVNSTEMPNWVWDHYQETPPMSSYLVAFIVSDLQPYGFNSEGRQYTIWTRKDAINQAVYSSTIVPKILKFYEGYFGINYTLPKMDMVAVPDFGFNAMENWGLITFRETALLWDNKLSTIDEKRSMALTMAHELTHQWFGNLATPKWWDDLWLKEGFASYFNYLGIDQVEPTWNITKEFINSDLDDAFSIDSLRSTRALSFDVNNSNQVRQAFDPISYSKGASVIRMMNHFLGESTFKAGISNYLKDHQFANANHDDLWRSMTEKAHAFDTLDPDVSIKDIMDTWVKQPGFPVVTAIADYDNRTVQVTQKRFFISGEDHDDEQTWWVPISYATPSNPDFDNTRPKVWIKNVNETTFELDTNDWWLLNLQHTGYYIVNYDETNWKRILGNVFSFPPPIRSQLLSNAMDLARANQLDYDIPLKLLLSIGRRDSNLVPYLVAFDKINYLYNILITTPVFSQFDVYLLAAFKNVFDNTDFNDSPSQPYDVQRIRRTVLKWACKRPDSRCVVDSRRYFRAWMVSSQPISPNIRSTVYCTAIREGGELEWNFAYDQYLKTTSVSEKNTILEALGCSSKPWMLTRYLNFMLTPESGVRKQDGQIVFSSVSQNIVGHPLAFDFLRSNWKRINDYYGVGFSRVSKMVSNIALYMHTPYQLKQLEVFKQENELGTTTQAFDNAIATIKSNMLWIENSYSSIENWLQDHSEHFGI